MKLQGSCHCGKVRFSIESAHPYPFNLCYCSICRKTAGGGGFAINLSGEADSLSVEGEEHITVYHVEEPGGPSPLGRRFCSHCGSMLWAWDSRWPELIHPFASAIDTPLPVPPEKVHLMLGSKASWVEPATGPGDQCFEEYPTESIADWHENRGLVS
jgi:hypothetical protein